MKIKLLIYRLKKSANSFKKPALTSKDGKNSLHAERINITEHTLVNLIFINSVTTFLLCSLSLQDLSGIDFLTGWGFTYFSSC